MGDKLNVHVLKVALGGAFGLKMCTVCFACFVNAA